LNEKSLDVKDGSGEQEEGEFFLEEGEVCVAGNQSGALKVG
jgi:hypothetical protein